MTRLTRPTPVPLWGAALVAVILMAPGVAHAQSLLASGGLGVPSEPLDARTRALGGVGVGMTGWQLLPVDPGTVGGVFLPSIAVSMQPSAVRVDGGESSGRTRFPLVAASYPYRGANFSLQFGSFLEQEWEARVERQIVLGDQEVLAVDNFQSLGGVGVVRFGAGMRITETLAIGVNVGTYIGAIERRFIRALDPDQMGPDVGEYRVRGRWRASGNTVSAGFAWDPAPLFRLGATVTHSGSLRLSPTGATEGDAKDYPIPLEIRAGGTFTLTPALSLVLGTTYADWAKTGQALAGSESRSGTWSYGGGLELTGTSLLGRPTPLRIGVREQQFPFHFQGAESSERTYSAGFGVQLAESAGVPIARFEFALERGSRSAGALSEEFWRSTVSLRLSGG